jgi:AraC-like DNA-binding protein
VAVSGSYVRSFSLIGLREICARLGVDCDDLLVRVGLDPTYIMSNDTLISIRACATLLEILSNETGVGDIGIQLSVVNQPHFPNLGSIVFMARFCKTVREWEAVAQDLWEYQANGFTFELIEESKPGTSILRYGLTDGSYPLRQHTEYAISNIIGLMRSVTGKTGENPSQVNLRHPQLEGCDAMAQFAGCAVEYRSEYNEIVFPTQILDYPTQGGLSFFKGILTSYVQSRLDSLAYAPETTTTTVRLAIASLLGTGKSDIQSIAELLGIHPKALQRQLAEENTTYTAVLEDVREKMAKDLMMQSKAPIAHIASLLGYATTAPFTLAFKRWTGEGPFQWRAQYGSAPTPRSRVIRR